MLIANQNYRIVLIFYSCYISALTLFLKDSISSLDRFHVQYVELKIRVSRLLPSVLVFEDSYCKAWLCIDKIRSDKIVPVNAIE